MKKNQSEIPYLDGHLHIEYKIIKQLLTSAMDAKIGAQFPNLQTGEYLQTTLTEMGHPLTFTSVARNKSALSGIINIVSKKWWYISINIRFY